MNRRIIVTHHAPDLDAVGAVWFLKRFDAQHFADAKVLFVNPGDTLSLEEAEAHGNQLHEVTHVDTGLGEFDHHQPDRGLKMLSASLLVYQHICKIHPELKTDKTLEAMANFITEIDHLGEVYWPEAGNTRYEFMIHELLHGVMTIDPHDDDSMLYFGLQCLDAAHAALTQHIKAVEIINTEAQTIEMSFGKCLAVETSNDDVIKVAQKQGYLLVIRKDSKLGNVRIKARPDAPFTLEKLSQAVQNLDKKGSWYYHPSGKMLINGSRKHRNQVPSPLTLEEVINLAKEIWPTSQTISGTV